MRIISGQYRGRSLPVTPKGFKARPTTDSAKENLFNILGNLFDFETINVLDLFAGTGGISYEFASRGCQSVDTVEIDFLHFNYIKSTVKTLDLKQIHVIRNDSFRFLNLCRKTYDIIFADPPYANDKITLIPQLVLDKHLLNNDGYLIIEHSANNDFSETENFINHRRYGSVNFSFFKNTI
ncbi:MAG: 16S rRNA (guanine(966)-N(2))-methyltransferase RsmD [Prevotellaceae bacterium]|jgi:16S rRNA (guanine(966)-N(2))-methyltransferase RsmD|nr:16S rRNA (guanine(966)-N(2))-methyltransferase RsmD [Prevotellaceae bacterium]